MPEIDKIKLTPAMEDYLEAIAILQEDTGVTRVKEISEYLKVAPSSVNSAVNKLAKKDLVNHVKHGYIVLTGIAKQRADRIRKKHSVLKKFLKDILQLDDLVSEKDACEMEHCISKKTLDRLVEFVAFLEQTPEEMCKNSCNIVENFQAFLKENSRS